MAKPNWPHWEIPGEMHYWTGPNGARYLTPEQAICLSLDIDPNGTFPEHERKRYAERLRELQDAIGWEKPPLIVKDGKVELSDFVLWAHQRPGWEDMPAELFTIAVDEPSPEQGAQSAAEIHENRYRAVGEDARFALFNVAELAEWASANKVAVPLLKMLVTDEHSDIPPARRFQPCGTLPQLMAMAYVPADMDPQKAQEELLAAGVTGHDGDPVGRLRERIAVSQERQLLNAVYDGKLTIYERTDYAPIDVTASRLRYKAQPESYIQDKPRQPTGQKPLTPVSAPLSSPVQFILPSGKYARASAGEIVLPADMSHVTVNVAIGLTVSAATIQFPNYVKVYEREGIDASNAGEVKFEHIDGRAEAERLALRDFPAACRSVGIRPRNPYSPYADDYIGASEQNVFYQLTVDELRKYAEPYSVTVRLEDATSVDGISDDPLTRAVADIPFDLGSGNSWQAQARRIADELFDRDTANSCRDSLKGYAKRVMGEMQTRQIHGPRGLINNPNTIQREALQGNKWWAGKIK